VILQGPVACESYLDRIAALRAHQHPSGSRKVRVYPLLVYILYIMPDILPDHVLSMWS